MYQGGREPGRPSLPSQKVCPWHIAQQSRGAPWCGLLQPHPRGGCLKGDLPKATQLSAAEPESVLDLCSQKDGNREEWEGKVRGLGQVHSELTCALPGPPHSPGSAAAHSYTSRESSLSSARHTPIWHFTTALTWGQQVCWA